VLGEHRPGFDGVDQLGAGEGGGQHGMDPGNRGGERLAEQIAQAHGLAGGVRAPVGPLVVEHQVALVRGGEEGVEGRRMKAEGRR